MNKCLHVDKVYPNTLLVVMNLVHNFNSKILSAILSKEIRKNMSEIV